MMMSIDQQYQKLEDTIRSYNPGADFAPKIQTSGGISFRLPSFRLK